MAQDKSALSDTDGKWSDLSGGQRVVFLGKLILFLLTFGYAYPNLLYQEDQ